MTARCRHDTHLQTAHTPLCARLPACVRLTALWAAGTDVDLRVPGVGRGASGRPPLLPAPLPAARPLDLDSELRALEESQEATQKNISMILGQAREQLDAGEISLEDYNDILRQVGRSGGGPAGGSSLYIAPVEDSPIRKEDSPMIV